MAPPIDILLPGRRETAVLLLHGLTGTPLEMRVLGERLAKDGHTVHIPLLPGRGTRVEDRYDLCWDDWMEDALHAYDIIARSHHRVVVGGLSAGGTMALDVALQRDPAALLLYAAVLQVSKRGAYLAPYVWRFIRRWPSPPSDMVEPNDQLQCYNPAPVRAMSELLTGVSRVRPYLDEIRAPTLVAHSLRDTLVPLTSAEEIASRVSGRPVEKLFLDGCGHAITADARRAEVAEASAAFVRRVLVERRPETLSA